MKAQDVGGVKPGVGKLLYNLGTRLPQQFHNHLPMLVEYVAQGHINREAKLRAAIKFIQVRISTATASRQQFYTSSISSECTVQYFYYTFINVLCLFFHY